MIIIYKMNYINNEENILIMYIIINTDLIIDSNNEKPKLDSDHNVDYVVESVIEKLLCLKNKKYYFNYLKWRNSDRRKIVLKATNQKINDLIDKYEYRKTIKNGEEFWCDYVEDTGYTQINAIVFCPIEKNKVPLWIKQLDPL